MVRVRKAGYVLLAHALVAALLVVGPVGALAATDFVDVPSGHTFEADIEWLSDAGITRGCNPPTNDRYCPEQSVTRGQMAAFLVRALSLTDDGGGNSFTDDNGSVFELDIAKLAAAGITLGCNPPANSHFCPDDAVTRGQMAAFLRRAIANRPIITTSSLPSATVGVAYSRELAAVGGTQPYVWTITSGDVPPGMLLNLDGTLSGIPSFPGTTDFTVNVIDAEGVDTSAELSLTVVNPLMVATSELPFASVGTAYSRTLSATGGLAPYTWTRISGSLPAGVTLASSGAIAGTPTTAATSNFGVRVTDSEGRMATAALTIITVGTDVAVTTVALDSGVVGQAYSDTLTAASGTAPYTWAVTVGSLPAGLSLNAGTGAITGTPTTAGTSDFTVQVTDAGADTAARALSIVVSQSLSISTTTLPGGTTGVAYSAPLAATGGATPYTWGLADGSNPLPDGLGLLANGTVEGTPDLAGAFSFTVMVTDDEGRTAEKALSISVTFNCDTVLGVTPDECQALVALYDATDGPNWANNSGWLAEANPCGGAWYGVTYCNQAPAQRHVTYLDLSGNGLSGPIPAVLGDMDALQYLNLSGNSLTGAIPTSLGNLTALHGLFLNNNDLSGSIPTQLGNLTGLRNLEADSNALTGTLPTQLGSLTELLRLRLGRNQLTGGIPVSFNNLTNLTSLTLHRNQLSGVISDGIQNLVNLQASPADATQFCGNAGLTGSAAVDAFLTPLDARWDTTC